MASSLKISISILRRELSELQKNWNCKTCRQRQERALDNCKKTKIKTPIWQNKMPFWQNKTAIFTNKTPFFWKKLAFFSERLALSISGLRECAKKTAFFQKKSPFFFGKSSCFFGGFQTWLFPKEDLLLSGVLSSAAKAFRPVFFVKAADCNAF